MHCPMLDPGPSITVYQNVSKPFLQIRQTGWTLAYLVIPAVASLAATRDVRGLDQLKYDGTRFLVGLLLPVTLLAGTYSAPFLSLWVGPRYAANAPLLRLFLVATLPLVLSVHAQMAIGLGKMEVVALPPLARVARQRSAELLLDDPPGGRGSHLGHGVNDLGHRIC